MKTVDKKWGTERWIANGKKYCGKILEVRKGGVSSSHLHNKKQETFYCLDGEVLLYLKDIYYVLKPDTDPVTIMPGEEHHFIGVEDSTVIEVSTEHKEEDVVRFTESAFYNGRDWD